LAIDKYNSRFHRGLPDTPSSRLLPLKALLQLPSTEETTVRTFRLAAVDPPDINPIYLPVKIQLLSRLRHPDLPPLVPRPSSTHSADVDAVLSSITASLAARPETNSSPISPSTLAVLAKDHEILRFIAESSSFSSEAFNMSNIPSLTCPTNLPAMQILALLYVSSRYRPLPFSSRLHPTVQQLLSDIDELPHSLNPALDQYFTSTLLAQIIQTHVDDVRFGKPMNRKKREGRVLEVTEEIRRWAEKRGDVQYAEMLLGAFAQGYMAGGNTREAVEVLEELGQDGYERNEPTMRLPVSFLVFISAS
jgi:hypothetical protein